MVKSRVSRTYELLCAGLVLLSSGPAWSAAFYYDFDTGAGGWQLGSGWSVHSLSPGDSVLAVDTQGDTFAWLTTATLGASWAIEVEFRFENLYNDNNHTGTAGIALAGNQLNLLLLADVIFSEDQYIRPGVGYYTGQWNNLLRVVPWYPDATNQIRLRLERAPGSDALEFTVSGANGFVRKLETEPVPYSMWRQIQRVGLRGFKSNVHFSSVAIETPLLAPGLSTNDVVSDFSESDEAWSVIELEDTFGAGPYTSIHRGPWQPAYLSAGGNPGGCLHFIDNPGDSFFFAAPGKFLGDVVAAYGRTLSFDLQANIPPTGDWYHEADVILTGGDGLVLATFANIVPTTAWNSYSIQMAETSWRVDRLDGRQPTRDEFLGVLADLESLWIRGEYFYGDDEILLDNVRLGMDPNGPGLPSDLPSLSIDVSRVRVTQNLIVGSNYVLESSNDLLDWTEVQPPFTALVPRMTNEFDVDLTGRFFRIRQVP